MSCPPIARLYHVYRKTLILYVGHTFPRLCPGAVEDAVEATFEELLRHADRLASAWDDGGERGTLRLMRTIAWRMARKAVKRGAGPREISVSAYDAASLGAAATRMARPAAQESVVHLSQIVDDVLPRVARQVSAKHAEALAEAYRESVATGDDDISVARRHGIPREYLSRMRREMRRLAQAS